MLKGAKRNLAPNLLERERELFRPTPRMGTYELFYPIPDTFICTHVHARLPHLRPPWSDYRCNGQAERAYWPCDR